MKIKCCSHVIVCNISCTICSILLLNMNIYLVAIKRVKEGMLAYMLVIEGP